MSFEDALSTRQALLKDFSSLEEGLSHLSEQEVKLNQSQLLKDIDRTRDRIQSMLADKEYIRIPNVKSTLSDLNSLLNRIESSDSFDQNDLNAISKCMDICRLIPAFVGGKEAAVDQKRLDELIDQSVRQGDPDTALRLIQSIQQADKRDNKLMDVAHEQFELAMRQSNYAAAVRYAGMIPDMPNQHERGNANRHLLEKIMDDRSKLLNAQGRPADFPQVIEKCMGLVRNIPHDDLRNSYLNKLLKFHDDNKEQSAESLLKIIPELPLGKQVEKIQGLLKERISKKVKDEIMVLILALKGKGLGDIPQTALLRSLFKAAIQDRDYASAFDIANGMRDEKKKEQSLHELIKAMQSGPHPDLALVVKAGAALPHYLRVDVFCELIERHEIRENVFQTMIASVAAGIQQDQKEYQEGYYDELVPKLFEKAMRQGLFNQAYAIVNLHPPANRDDLLLHILRHANDEKVILQVIQSLSLEKQNVKLLEMYDKISAKSEGSEFFGKLLERVVDLETKGFHTLNEFVKKAMSQKNLPLAFRYARMMPNKKEREALLNRLWSERLNIEENSIREASEKEGPSQIQLWDRCKGILQGFDQDAIRMDDKLIDRLLPMALAANDLQAVANLANRSSSHISRNEIFKNILSSLLQMDEKEFEANKEVLSIILPSMQQQNVVVWRSVDEVDTKELAWRSVDEGDTKELAWRSIDEGDHKFGAEAMESSVGEDKGMTDLLEKLADKLFKKADQNSVMISDVISLLPPNKQIMRWEQLAREDVDAFIDACEAKAAHADAVQVFTPIAVQFFMEQGALETAYEYVLRIGNLPDENNRKQLFKTVVPIIVQYLFDASKPFDDSNLWKICVKAGLSDGNWKFLRSEIYKTLLDLAASKQDYENVLHCAERIDAGEALERCKPIFDQIDDPMRAYALAARCNSPDLREKIIVYLLPRFLKADVDNAETIKKWIDSMQPQNRSVALLTLAQNPALPRNLFDYVFNASKDDMWMINNVLHALFDNALSQGFYDIAEGYIDARGEGDEFLVREDEQPQMRYRLSQAKSREESGKKMGAEADVKHSSAAPDAPPKPPETE